MIEYLEENHPKKLDFAKMDVNELLMYVAAVKIQQQQMAEVQAACEKYKDGPFPEELDDKIYELIKKMK